MKIVGELDLSVSVLLHSSEANVLLILCKQVAGFCDYLAEKYGKDAREYLDGLEAKDCKDILVDFEEQLTKFKSAELSAKKTLGIR